MERRAQKSCAEIRMKKIKRSTLKAWILAGLLGLGAAGGVSAYLTDHEEAVNSFTVGKVDIKLEEPNWKPEEHKDIEPGKNIEKDPQIKNTGVNHAFVYLEVGIPMADVTAVSEDGKRLEKKLQELFDFTARKSWSLLESKKKDNTMIYVYAYNKILKPSETTEALFDTVKFLNVVEGQLDTKTLQLPVRAYAIQTSYTGGDKGTVSDQAKAAYQKYVNQNLGQGGAASL